MRLLILLFFTSINIALAQQRVVVLDTLPKSGAMVLEKGWHWQGGDNPAWASPTLDDSRWDSLHPARTLGMQDKTKAAGNGWLRLHLSVDTSLIAKDLYVNVEQAGASEIYLDGQLIRRIGTIGNNPSVPISYSPTLYEWYPFPVRKPGLHVLAVRWAYHKPAWYVPIDRAANQPMFKLTLRPAHTLMEAVALPKAKTVFSPLIVGIFLMLSTVQFLYYLYRRQRVNLYFGLTSLFFALARGCDIIRPLQTDLVASSWLAFLSGLSYILYSIYLCATFYVFLNKRITWLFRVLTATVLLAFFADHFTDQEAMPVVLVTAGLGGLFISLLVTSVTALRAKQANARLVLTPLLIMIGVMISVVVVALILRGHDSVTLKLAGYAAALIINFTIPLTLAVILARENAQINRDLEARLNDVEQLSAEKEAILTQQKATLENEVAQRTATLNQSLQELRNTQTQLVQREKMASLGELTAGIAHEIQNPLNFVNNFADVSGELIAELRQEQTRPTPDRDPALEADLLTNIEQNVGKIGHHGGRAASIVRGMLEHARTTTGERQPTDLNALADEYMRLSYHGLRSKDKHGSTASADRGRFNATLVTEFDPTLPPINVVTQDIGRVLLNLFNNAFYAVQEKTRTTPESYKPTVTVTTHAIFSPDVEPSNRPERAISPAQSTGLGPGMIGPGMMGPGMMGPGMMGPGPEKGSIEIKISDNGNGIPLALQRKIFQPFFTTKPTGEGTGLGLSLSFDIITKGHGGSLTVDTCPGQFTTFIIRLPA